jgi:hypothetical protein
MRHFCSIFLALALYATATRADVVFDNGAPSAADGFEITRWLEAERFTVTDPTVIEGMKLWTVEAIPASFYGSYWWEIRASSASNLPGAVVANGLSMGLTHSATGRTIFGYPERMNTFTIPALYLQTGNYWLALHNGPMNNFATQDIFWESAINADTEPSYCDETPFVGAWDTNGSSSKLAFQLSGVFAPKVTSISFTGQAARLSFTTALGRTYRVEYKNTWNDISWTVLLGAEDVAGTGGIVQVDDPSARTLGKRFYRVVMVGSMMEPQVAPDLAPPLLTIKSQDGAPRTGEGRRLSERHP